MRGIHAGTRALPFFTIQQAIDTAAAEGDSADVYVEAGTYDESLTLHSGVSIYGRYQIASGSVWVRGLGMNNTSIVGGTTAVSGNGVSDIVIDGLDISSAIPSTPGANSIVISLSNSDNVVISRNSLLAGSGIGGADGGNGGSGGFGGGGGGGPSICIAMDSQSTEISFSSNTYHSGTAGSGGSGGAAPASRGADGISAETRVF